MGKKAKENRSVQNEKRVWVWTGGIGTCLGVMGLLYLSYLNGASITFNEVSRMITPWLILIASITIVASIIGLARVPGRAMKILFSVYVFFNVLLVLANIISIRLMGIMGAY